MKQILIQKGAVSIEEVPAPKVEPGTILVKVTNSCISTGTESKGIQASGESLWERALKKPENISKFLVMAKTKGAAYAKNFAQEKLTTSQPTGYSAAGIIIEIGEGITDLKVGDSVACMGAQCAYHAEIIRVPRNLAARLPEDVTLAHASTGALGAIALQGIRRLSPTMGETFAVIGLGILGQITAQLLRANGCRSIGIDIDITRVSLAQSLGMDYGLSTDSQAIEEILRITGGTGVDGVIITANTDSNQVISTAFAMCRKKARVVLVGSVGMNLNREEMYQKELDFLISTSYGPGRYDNLYEETGVEYPIGYVRWSQNRNLTEYLRLIAEKKIIIQPLITAIYPITDAQVAFATIDNPDKKPLITLLSYSKSDEQPSRTVINPHATAIRGKQIGIAVIGAGSFARATHLPNIVKMRKQFRLEAICSRNGHTALNAAKRFAAQASTTDFESLLNNPAIDAVLIATRHNLHASMVLAALHKRKHVFVEKPLALTKTELDDIVRFYETHTDSAPILLTGFNRRFSPYAAQIQKLISKRHAPLIINYRFNAGLLPNNHWAKTFEGGGRNLGEACHIYDLFTYLTGSKVTSINVQAISSQSDYASFQENFIATISFEDGSLANLIYTSLGNARYPKEQMELFCDGNVVALDDYTRLTITGKKNSTATTRIAHKGFAEELQSFADAILNGKPSPIPLWQQYQATSIALEVEQKLNKLCAE